MSYYRIPQALTEQSGFGITHINIARMTLYGLSANSLGEMLKYFLLSARDADFDAAEAVN